MTSITKIKKCIPHTITATVGIVAGFFGAAGVHLYPHNNSHYQEEGNEIFEKVDGLFSYTRLTRYASGSDELARFSKEGIYLYIDQERDGVVDVLKVPESPRGLYRESDLEDYQPTFNKADQDFQEQLKRFASVLNETKREM